MLHVKYEIKAPIIRYIKNFKALIRFSDIAITCIKVHIPPAESRNATTGMLLKLFCSNPVMLLISSNESINERLSLRLSDVYSAIVNDNIRDIPVSIIIILNTANAIIIMHICIMPEDALFIDSVIIRESSLTFARSCDDTGTGFPIPDMKASIILEKNTDIADCQGICQ